jgi:hypothetical protein
LKDKNSINENRDFTPLSDDVIRNHLIGLDPSDRYRREYVIGEMRKKQRQTALNALEFLATFFTKLGLSGRSAIISQILLKLTG